MGLIDRFAKNPVASNLLMIALVVGGVVAASRAKIEMFPDFSLDMITISVVMPGAAPEEVEESLCVPIEEEVFNLEGVDRVRSTAVEGAGTVVVEVEKGADAESVLADVKSRVDSIDTFPELAESPIVEDVLLRNLVTNVAVFGDVEEGVLRRVAEEVRDEMADIDGISQVELVSVRDYEISIELSEPDLQRLGLTFDEVANAIRASSIDLSGGTLRTPGGEILLRTKSRAYRGDDFEQLTLRTRPDGSRILLGDVAKVVDGFADVDQQSLFEGKPTALIQVYRVGDESALGIASQVRDFVDARQAVLPTGVELRVWQDGSRMLKDRLELMLRNGLQGLLLVFCVLALFLRFRLSIWVTLGIPISFLGAMIVLPFLGVSINLLSLFAFILVLGIVVDDAIIVGESVSAEREAGREGQDAALRGTHKVAVPVVFAILTTIVAFAPLLNVPGTFGKFFGVIPLAVIPILLFSLVESQLILPAHLAHESPRLSRLAEVAPFRWWTSLQQRFARALTWYIDNVYLRSLRVLLRFRYATVAGAIAMLLATIGLLLGGFVKAVFMPPVDGDVISARLEMPLGTPSQVTSRAVDRIERALDTLREEISAEHGDVFVGAMSSVGSQPYSAAKGQFDGKLAQSAGNLGEVTVELTPAEEREVTTGEISDRWRELVGTVPGATELAFDSSLMPAGKALEFQLGGRDVAQLREAAAELKDELARIDGVQEITDTFRGGRDELVVDVRPSAQALGLTQLEVARQVRQGFYGEEAQRIQRGRHEVKVMVRYPNDDRHSLSGVERMRIRTPSGGEVPFDAVASVDLQRGYATIERSDRKRIVTVKADVDEKIANATEIQQSISGGVLPGILARHPGVTYSLEGEQKEQAEMRSALGLGFALALLAIFGIMAVPFRSYVQPAIVMTAIPFGLVGAVLGHLLMGVEISTLSMCGLAALAGVVVNDSLVLVDFINRRREEHTSIHEAVVQAGRERFRPILLTSLTTFAGLTPLLLEKSVQAQFLIPMAISLGFGVLFSTLITLVLVPSLYLVLEDGVRTVSWLYGSARADEKPDFATT